ncbi:MAG: phosphoglucosamine mutase [Firmicutes bacterium]|jgi:phosphoglucosamine mutase|nr:phosphoglucosamine mutase [Bacillota bacterium]
MRSLFGTDGVRGVANRDLDAELAYRVARAGAHFLLQSSEAAGKRPAVIVGKDTRISGDLLEAAVVAGICSVGATALKAGVLTTPGVAFLARTLDCAGGIMISASHNPVEYNGIKILNASGFKLPDDVEREIDKMVRAPSDGLPRPTGAEVGRARGLAPAEASELYIEFLRTVVDGDLGGLNVVVDCANGSASAVAPEVFRRLGAQVTAMNDAPDGVNINVGCGSTRPAALCEAVRVGQAQCGFAYDGDADRCIASDERGNVVDGDQILAICGLEMAARGALKGGTVVATVLSNLGLDIALKKSGVSVKRTRVGDRYVLEEMLRSGYNLGGEQSGHVIFLDHTTTGDGILTSLKIASIIKAGGRKLSELAGVMSKLPQVMVNVKVSAPISELARMLGDSARINDAVKQAEEYLGESGRVVVRPSGTEPLIRVMVEADDASKALKLAENVGEVIRRELGGS